MQQNLLASRDRLRGNNLKQKGRENVGENGFTWKWLDKKCVKRGKWNFVYKIVVVVLAQYTG